MVDTSGPRVVGVDDVEIKLVRYVDNAGRTQVTLVAVFGGEAVKFRDDQLVLDRKNTLDFIADGVKAHVEALKDEGTKEA